MESGIPQDSIEEEDLLLEAECRKYPELVGYFLDQWRHKDYQEEKEDGI